MAGFGTAWETRWVKYPKYPKSNNPYFTPLSKFTKQEKKVHV